MSDFDNGASAPKGVSRRTVAKAMAWSVPVVAVAATAPLVAASPVIPPPPVFNFGNAVKNPGNSCTTTCVMKQSYGVPVTVSNPAPTNFIIKFTDYKIDGDAVGVNNVGVVYGGTINCANKVSSCTHSCAGATAANSVCIPAGQTYTFWVFSNSKGASPQGGQEIPWEWIDPNDACSVVLSDSATSATSPPNDAC